MVALTHAMGCVHARCAARWVAHSVRRMRGIRLTAYALTGVQVSITATPFSRSYAPLPAKGAGSPQQPYRLYTVGLIHCNTSMGRASSPLRCPHSYTARQLCGRHPFSVHGRVSFLNPAIRSGPEKITRPGEEGSTNRNTPSFRASLPCFLDRYLSHRSVVRCSCHNRSHCEAGDRAVDRRGLHAACMKSQIT